MSTGKLTFCIPAYNCAEFIAETITALKKQTFSDWGALISVDCSTDASVEHCKELTADDSRFRIIEQTKRLGWVDNANFLLEQVDTAFYMIHPHDDYLSENYVEVILTYLERHLNAFSAVGSLKYLRTNKSLNLAGVKAGSTFERLRDYLCEPRNGLPFRAIARRGADGTVPLLRTHRYESKGVDLVWILELLIQGNSSILPEAVYWKRSREGGLTGSWGKWPLTRRIAACAEYVAMMADVINHAPVNAAERIELLALLHHHVQRYIVASPRYFGGDAFTEAERLSLASIAWARVALQSPLEELEIGRLLSSQSLNDVSREIVRLADQAVMRTEKGEFPKVA